MISNKFFILIGGFGRRLQQVISDIPKPMAPIEGKPFLWYKINQLKHCGFKNFVFCAGYLSQNIMDYFKDGSKFSINIEYSIEDEPLGTAGAIKYAEKYIDKPFFLGNGDTYQNFDAISMLRNIHEKKAKYGILLTDPKEKGQEGLILKDDDGKILKFDEKPKHSFENCKINAGIYYLSPNILDFIPNRKCSLEREIFPRLIENKESFFGFDYKGYFIDIGIPKNYYQFIDDIKKGIIKT